MSYKKLVYIRNTLFLVDNAIEIPTQMTPTV